MENTEHIENIKIKDALYDAMAIRKILPIDLAKKSGISPSSISRYLSGEVIPKQKAIYSLAVALDVDVAYIMGFTKELKLAHTDEINHPERTAEPPLGEMEQELLRICKGLSPRAKAELLMYAYKLEDSKTAPF